MSTIVTTQTQLDAAVTAGKKDIVIDSPKGVWLIIRDSSSVVARGSSSVDAWGSSSVVAWGSSSVVAWDSSSVDARGSSSVDARDSSSVVAWDSSSVVAWDSSSVVARDSSSVDARGSSSVVAWGSSSVVAWDSSSVDATKYVAVHLHSKRVKLRGNGVVIDVTELDLSTRADWLDYHGVKVSKGKAVVYKAVDQDFNAGHSYTLTNYPIGKKVVASDWMGTQACGSGLHFGYTPSVAKAYFNGEGKPRFLAVEIDATTFVALDDKCKAPAGKVLFEVDIHGRQVGS